jgi:DNA-binding MarR family transcriptional regulator
VDIKTIRKFRANLRKFERIIEDQKDTSCCCGVTVSQCHALMELDELDDLTVNELSEKLDLDKSTVSRIIESLVQSNFVSRENPKDNRRIAMIALTRKGKLVCDQINDLNDQYVEKILNAVPGKDLPVFLRSFEKIINTMSKNDI